MAWLRAALASLQAALASLQANGPQRVLLLSIGLGGVSGLMYALSIPRTDMGGLAWICLLPCFVALYAQDGCRAPALWRWPPRTVGLGLAFGLASGTGRVYWIAETLTAYGNLTWVEAVLTNAALILYLSLYPVCFFVIVGARFFPRFDSPQFAWLSACLWVLLEWAQSWIITGFPWELLGYSQYRNLPLLQTASVTGIYGLSFALVVVNASLSQALTLRRRPLPCLGPPGFLLALMMTLGYIRMQELAATALDGPGIRVGIVQGNVPQGEKWTAGRLQSTDKYVDLTRQLLLEESSPPFDLIIFPETSLPFALNHPTYASQRQKMVSLVRGIRVPLLVGSLERTAENDLRNRALLFDIEGEVIAHYDKVHLVPFGEYLPMPWLFQYMEGLTAESGAFTHGRGFDALPLPRVEGESLPFGVFICYESVFPEITRALVRKGAQFIVNTTNDAWFGDTAAPFQHLSMAVVRAVETGRPLLRAANTGISAVVRPTGEILQTTPLFETATLAATIVPRSETTPYVQYGDYFVALCGLPVIVSVAIAFSRRRHRRQ